MSALMPLDPKDVYERGLRDPESLSDAERLVYILIELETYADMEGWDHFFTTDQLRYFTELKAGLVASGDVESLEVLQHYEDYLASHGVTLDADSIDAFLCSRPDAESDTLRDWREDFSCLCPARWQKVGAYLRRCGWTMA
jgi:hypothetical protein